MGFPFGIRLPRQSNHETRDWFLRGPKVGPGPNAWLASGRSYNLGVMGSMLVPLPPLISVDRITGTATGGTTIGNEKARSIATGSLQNGVLKLPASPRTAAG
jgi:hypothetical protein